MPPTETPKVLVYLAYGVSFSAPLGARIPFELRDGVGIPPLGNVLTVVGAQSAIPMLHGGGGTVAPRPACIFMRGDANFDGDPDVADAIFVLSYLFRGNPATCLDALDANDSGNVDIGDAIYVLAFLFAGGPVPVYPYPDEGIDPTDDDELGECVCP